MCVSDAIRAAARRHDPWVAGVSSRSSAWIFEEVHPSALGSRPTGGEANEERTEVTERLFVEVPDPASAIALVDELDAAAPMLVGSSLARVYI
jgi:hypothetical protein